MAGQSDTYVIDTRSDTLSQPTEAMRYAMYTGTTKDDVYNEDPTVHELQNKAAELFGKEAALFVPSGTMGNLISVLCHCNKRGQEVLLGDKAHLIIFEQGGIAQIGGVMPRTMPNKPDGTFDLDELDDYIRVSDDHHPETALVCVENTHGNCGGKVLPLDFLAELRAKTRALSLPVHMDGARVMSAAVSLGVELKDILQYVDSASICLSKGAAAPIGSLITGTVPFIKQAKRLRKVLGGGWRQPGPLAAAGLVALKEWRERITGDHKHAKVIANAIMEKANNVVHVDVEGVHSNVVFVTTVKPGLTGSQFCDRLSTISPEEEKACAERISILALAAYKNMVRIIFCHNQTDADIEKMIKKLHYVLDEYSA